MECLFAALLWENRVRAVPGRFLKTPWILQAVRLERTVFLYSTTSSKGVWGNG